MDQWQQMTESDVPDMLRIADIVHADLPESAEVLGERLALFPAGCLTVAGGYAIAHPALIGAPPPLDTLLRALPARPDTLHVHDIALLPARQGHGLGATALGQFAALAMHLGLPRLSLIAVHGTPGYWRRFGFEAAAPADVSSYGAGAIYMTAAAVIAARAPRRPRPNG